MVILIASVFAAIAIKGAQPTATYSAKPANQHDSRHLE
jgi:hypothetical protein